MARVMSNPALFSYNAVQIEDELNSIVQTIDVPAADITAFLDAYQNVLAGKKSVKTEIAGSADLAASQGWKTLFAGIGAGPKSTVLDLVGTGPAAGAPEYQCTSSGLTGVLVAGMTLRLPVGDAARYSATLQHSGSTSRAVA